MPTITCPNCGKSGSLKSRLPPGAKVPCTRCNFVFRFAPSDGGSRDRSGQSRPRDFKSFSLLTTNQRPRPEAGKLISASSVIRITDFRPVQRGQYRWR